jgi:hypothetical protein
MSVAEKPLSTVHCPVRLNLSACLISNGTIFFSHNKSANNTFSHGLSAKQTWRITQSAGAHARVGARSRSGPFLNNTNEIAVGRRVGGEYHKDIMHGEQAEYLKGIKCRE